MLLSSLLLIPIVGVFIILANKDNEISLKNIKLIGLTASILNFFLSLIIFILFDFSSLSTPRAVKSSAAKTASGFLCRERK